METTFKGRKIIYRQGYPAVCFMRHHRSNASGIVDVHILVAEDMLGRPLQEAEVVHHIDENRENYLASNLMIFDTATSHATYHMCIKNQVDFKMSCWNGVWHCENISGAERRGSHYVCPKCGGIMLSRHARMCRSCCKREAAKNIPSKEQLCNDLQPFTSFRQIAKKYGVSDTAVRKWCKRYNLPYHSKDYK